MEHLVTVPQEQDKMDEPSFGDWLTRQLETHGLGQREFAARVGVKHPAVRTWLSGFSTPEWHTCRGIADALGLDRSEVRERAGYVDPDAQPRSEPGAPDQWLETVLAAWPSLDEIDREGLSRTALALRDYQRRRRSGR